MIGLRSIDSFHLGGRAVTLSGLPVSARRMAAGAAPRPIDPNGSSFTGQMYVQAFRQAAPRHALPVLLWHGGGLTGACWETTPDGRPGWLMWFLAQGYDVLVSDAVERGRAGWSRWPEIYAEPPIFRTMGEAWESFRFGPAGSWNDDPARRAAHTPMLFPTHAMDSFARQFVPRWADHEAITMAAYEALLDRVGPCIVVAHSQGGGFAFEAAQRRPELVRAVVALEPSGAPAFLPGRLPPHLILWGDHVAAHPEWSRYRSVVDDYATRLAASGCPVRIVDLPETGLAGNSHMLMMDHNSDALAAMATDWLSGLELDGAPGPPR
jgi:pimeloyl-ACP methyl ester carboxylesterase